MPRRISTLFAAITSIFTACTVDFDVDPPGKFSCEDDSDCIAPNECRPDGTCGPPYDPACIDNDGDGFAVGDTAYCPKCTNEGLCDEDCNDDDEAVNPGVQDTCDGKDNNCNGEVDEPTDCETNSDCPAEPGNALPFCEGGVCVYKPAIQPAGAPECQDSLRCVDGTREAPPETCQ